GHSGSPSQTSIRKCRGQLSGKTVKMPLAPMMVLPLGDDQLAAAYGARRRERHLQQGSEVHEAQITHDKLAVERLEVPCIWAAEASGKMIDFRGDTSPQAFF